MLFNRNLFVGFTYTVQVQISKTKACVNLPRNLKIVHDYHGQERNVFISLNIC